MVRHKIHHIFDNEAGNKIQKFWKYRYRPMYRPQKAISVDLYFQGRHPLPRHMVT